jgi:hypothetical protein
MIVYSDGLTGRGEWSQDLKCGGEANVYDAGLEAEQTHLYGFFSSARES